MARLRPAAALVCTLALTAGAVAPAHAGSAKPTVGSALGGSKKLSDANGARLKKGAKLTLGERIVLGKGVRATLRLVRPAGVDSDTDLVKLDPVGGAKAVVGVVRDGHATVVTISPA
jgi:hypothetical protein